MIDYNLVFKTLKSIPYGKVTTYKAIAEKFNTSPRVIGYILSKNKDTKEYPCYKVVRSDGRIGGYTINNKNNGRTAAIKRSLIIKEGISINGDRVDKKYILRKI